jgi:putative oxidoreductase
MDLGVLALIGRVLVGAAFLFSGVRMLINLPLIGGLLAAKGVPYPRLVGAAGGVFEMVMGLAAVVGVWFPGVAIALAVFIVAATIMVHDFWNAEGMQRITDVNAVISNVIIVGALLGLAGLSA